MRGRFRVGPGDVLWHAPFEAHLDRFFSRSTEILNLCVSKPLRLSPCAGRVADADAIARAAERDPTAASALLLEAFVETGQSENDWPDLLASDLRKHPERSLGAWARRMGLAGETLSRGFRKLYGVAPARFRAEARAGRALDLISGGNIPLASVAAQAGFADQPHMTRAIKKLTGKTPAAWISTSNPFKTAGD
ncbi:MAG: helix-turn-helix transcriptional regulator [Proteobacteria bacterium]|nr:helix-turn-helix transcriptional regulator [Pseudomonadota bacterium]